jgi:hypothetical protein
MPLTSKLYVSTGPGPETPHLLEEWASFRCPTKTGTPWTREEIEEAIARGPPRLALSPEAIQHFAVEAEEKVHTKQARLVLRDNIKDCPPKELKISPIAAIPHKSKEFNPSLTYPFIYDWKMEEEGGW